MAGTVMVASVPHRTVPFVLCVFSAVFFPPLGNLTLDEAALFSWFRISATLKTRGVVRFFQVQMDEFFGEQFSADCGVERFLISKRSLCN
jgi:hypothetical protein